MDWRKLFRRRRAVPLYGQYYRVVFTLYSEDAKREVKVLEFEKGESYLDESEWVAGTTFENRHGGRLVGSFASPEDAERFVISTDWFRGQAKP
jgi:hypothetical protein